MKSENEIHKGNLCSICKQSCIHKSYKIRLLTDQITRRVVIDTHPHCRKVKQMIQDYYR
jgi:hypothetical protein